MPDTTANVLAVAARTMDEVVVPAVDRDDALAREQAEIIAATLHMLAQRVGLLHDKARFEFAHYFRLAHSIRARSALLDPELEDELRNGLERASEMLAGDPLTEALHEATRRLTGLISAVMRCAQDDAGPDGEALVTQVIAAGDELVGMQRAWFLPQGWERDPSTLGALSEILAGAPQAGRAATAGPSKSETEE